MLKHIDGRIYQWLLTTFFLPSVFCLSTLRSLSHVLSDLGTVYLILNAKKHFLKHIPTKLSKLVYLFNP